MAMTSTMLFWPALVLASATCGPPVLVLARTSYATEPKPHCKEPPRTTPHGPWDAWQSAPRPRFLPPATPPPAKEEKLAAFRLDYAITREEASGEGLFSGRFDVVENRPLEVSTGAPSILLGAGDGKSHPVSRVQGPGYKLRFNTHEASNGRILVDISYEEGTPSGGRVLLKSTALAKPFETAIAKLEWPGGGREIAFTLRPSNNI